MSDRGLEVLGQDGAPRIGDFWPSVHHAARIPSKRVIVTGDRNRYAPELAESVVNRFLAKYRLGLVIVDGATTGIDRSFAEACGELGVEQEAHTVRWEELDHPEAVIRYRANRTQDNANAGPIRNAEMCLAFHLAISASKGTKDCVRRAIEAGIPTYLINSDAVEPKRLLAGDARLR